MGNEIDNGSNEELDDSSPNDNDQEDADEEDGQEPQRRRCRLLPQ